jgi:hypothetical protein
MNIRDLITEAECAGSLAMVTHTPKPMTVVNGREQYFVSEGACGFAWVKVYGVKLSTKIGKEFTACGFRKSYEGGIQYWVSGGGQSIERKEAFAHAFAKVLTDNGFTAYANSRMD